MKIFHNSFICDHLAPGNQETVTEPTTTIHDQNAVYFFNTSYSNQIKKRWTRWGLTFIAFIQIQPSISTQFNILEAPKPTSYKYSVLKGK